MRKKLILLLIIVVCISTNTFADEGFFAQFDKGAGGETGVVATQLQNIQISTAYSQWSSSGKSLSGGISSKVYSSSDVSNTFKLNAGIGVIDHQSDANSVSPSASGIGLKISAEDYKKWDIGSIFVMAEYNSAFRTWLTVIQLHPANSNLGLELSSVGDDRWYVGQKFAVTWRLGNTPWSLRMGKQIQDATSFVGITYNSF